MYMVLLRDIQPQEVEEATKPFAFPTTGLFAEEPARVEVVQGVAVAVYGPMTLSTGRIVYWVRDATGANALATSDILEERIQREDRVEEARSIALQAIENLDTDAYSAALLLSNLKAVGRWRPLAKAKGAEAWSSLCRERLKISPDFANALVEQARSINRALSAGTSPLPKGFPDDDASLAAFGNFERMVGDAIAPLDAPENPSWGASKTKDCLSQLASILPQLRARMIDGFHLGQTAVNAAWSFGPAEYRPVSDKSEDVETAFKRVFPWLFGESVGTFGRLSVMAPHLMDEE